MFPAIRVRDAADLSNCSLALVELLLCDVIHPIKERVLSRPLGGKRRCVDRKAAAPGEKHSDG